MGTEVPIAKFPEPETPIDFEDLPFWDSVQEYISPVNVPVDVNKLYDSITNAEIVKDGEYIFKGSTNKQRFINNSKQE